MTGRPRVSAVVITLNEESNVAPLLRCLSWADETILVDGGSKDRTMDAARRMGAKVFERSFDTYALQRNFATSQAKGEWILSIDADERPSSNMPREVEAVIQDRRVSAFRVPIRSLIFGRRFRFCGTQDDRPIRLYRRDHGKWTGDVHEVLQVSGRVSQLASWLEHRTLPDFASFLAKMQRYTTLAAQSRMDDYLPPHAADSWFRPAREVFRRLVWKHGWLDGPEGWAFCLLSGVSEWVLARKHLRAWGRCRAGRGTGDRCEFERPVPGVGWLPSEEVAAPRVGHA
jgi:glycosyltransferase involved in cell wall biosynthesis